MGCFKGTASKHVYYLGWNRSPAQAGCMRQALGPGALGKPRGSGWRGRWEGGSGWGTHVNPRLFHFNVWQNPLQIKKKKESFEFLLQYFTSQSRAVPDNEAETMRSRILHRCLQATEFGNLSVPEPRPQGALSTTSVHAWLDLILSMSSASSFLRQLYLGLLWSPVGWDLAFQCRGCGFDPWSGN